VGTVKFEARIKELVETLPDMAIPVKPLLVRRVLREQISVLHRRLLAVIRDDDVCRRLMTVRWGNSSDAQSWLFTRFGQVAGSSNRHIRR
jgi:hypothetical protein